MKARVLGHGPPLVMVPGWGMSGAAWTDLAEALTPRWRVCLIDLPGHGDNRGVPFGADAAGQLMAAAPAGAVWLGWSLGAQLALSAALEGAEIAALVLLCPTPRFVRAPDWPAGMDEAALAALAERVRRDPASGLDRFLGLLGRAGADDRAAVRRLRQRLAGVEHDVQGLLAGLDWLARTDLRPRLPELSLPTWWLAGDADPIVPVEAAAKGAARAPLATAVPIHGAGHLPFLTHRGVLLSILEQVRTMGPL